MDNTFRGKELLIKAREYIETCKKCGFCKAVCPVLKNSEYIETFSPRGRMLLLQGLYEGKLKPREYLALRLYCTLCGYCSIKCVSGLELTEAYVTGRAYLLINGVALNEITNLSGNIIKSDNPYGVDNSVKNMWMDFLPEKPKSKSSIVYWLGCTTSVRRPDSAATAYQLISGLVGGDVAVLDGEPCCGWPLYLAGDLEGYKQQVTKALEAVKASGAEVLITTCPACTRSLRDKAKELGINNNIKIYHLIEYLTELDKNGKLPKLELNETITYHDPCELGRHMKITKEPRQIINKIKGIKLIEMKGNQLESNCCGGGGLYQILHMDRAYRVASLRLRDIPQGVKTLVSSCPSCKMTLETAVRNEGLDIEVLDIADLLMRAKKE
ncbi:MAG: (Fe-S)-binding protein [Sulfolobales archaeon]